jgi:hypothetical protein
MPQERATIARTLARSAGARLGPDTGRPSTLFFDRGDSS